MSRNLKTLGVVTAVSNTVYLFWLFQNIIGSLGLLLFFAEALMASLTILFLINHWKQQHTFRHYDVPKGSVDIFLTVVNEPIEIFERTLKAATDINYEDKKVYVLDDGPSENILKLCKKYNAIYLARNSNKHYKAGNLNFGLQQSSGDYILVIDADQMAYPTIIKDLIGYFSNSSKLAILSTRQSFYNVPENDFNHDSMFYEHMQTGKNIDNAAISCGSGVFYRRSALKVIGGFQIWNIVEDLYTSYVFHSFGYESLYINEIYTKGLAPQDLSTIYKQRGTWALDTLRLFFYKSPFFFRGLTFRQRLHYTEIALAYIVSAVTIPIFFLLPIITLYFNHYIVLNPEQYLQYRLPSLALILIFYYILGNKTFSTSQFWASLFPVYLKALILSLLPIKTRYKVTDKLAGVGKRDTILILPHILFIVAASFAVFHRLSVDGGITIFLAINLIWIILMIFWFLPIIKKGLLLE